ncbi:MAG: YfiR family protein [Planctomycetes bacterium]|nr:YfiR family protein [Planctomycetota bacterium]
MKNKAYILAVCILFAALFAVPAMAADSKEDREQKIKAAFLYNFINFVDWPKEKMPDNDEPIIIGILGNKDFIKDFAPIKDKRIRGKDIVIRYFEDLNVSEKSENKDGSKQKQIIESLKKCHVVFLCSCDSASTDNLAEITAALGNSPVLMVGEQAEFLENGGHIRFLVEKKKVRFEINLDSAERDGLKIRSKLLKLATRVIQEDSEEAKN